MNGLEFKCKWCGKKHNGSLAKSYCSIKCRNFINATSKRFRVRDKEKNLLRCKRCGKFLEVKDLFCSEFCREKSRVTTLKSYRKNKLKRKESLKESRKKAYYSHRQESLIQGWAVVNCEKALACSNCGSKKNLHLHHLVYKKSKDCVVTLCSKCHGAVHRKYNPLKLSEDLLKVVKQNE